MGRPWVRALRPMVRGAQSVNRVSLGPLAAVIWRRSRVPCQPWRYSRAGLNGPVTRSRASLVNYFWRAG